MSNITVCKHAIVRIVRNTILQSFPKHKLAWLSLHKPPSICIWWNCNHTPIPNPKKIGPFNIKNVYIGIWDDNPSGVIILHKIALGEENTEGKIPIISYFEDIDDVFIDGTVSSSEELWKIIKKLWLYTQEEQLY